MEWEILVVDNNSADQTRQVVEDCGRRHPNRFRYVREPHPGKSYALNTGVREATGDVLAFTDDDVTVEPDWLDNLTRNLASGEWAGAGGRILMAEKFTPPPWLALDGPYSMAGLIAGHLDLGPEPRQLPQAPYGGNMAYRKDAFIKYGGFRTDLGPCPNGKNPRANEDTEFGRRLMAGGERLRYEPSAVLYHPVHMDRLRKDYFLHWYFDYGRARARERGRGPDVLGIHRCYFSIPATIARGFLAAMRWVIEPDRQKRFFFKGKVWFAFGGVLERFRLLTNGS
jgi:glycosyltransferase involved in cell wall biosynthesis